MFLFFVQVFLYGAMAGIIFIAGILYQRGAITIGAITSFLFYMVLLLVNFGMVASVFGNVMAILGASDKIVEIMSVKP
jgi:ABC-type multidrug transport system fused ATPase/permease subunit